MSLKKKIAISSILMVVIPVLLILVIWTGYVRWGGGGYLKAINRSSEGGDRLTDAMNILFTYEAELSDMNWDVVMFQDDGGSEIIISPERERVEELESLGYHIQVAYAHGTAFSNMDEADLKVLEDTGTGADGALYWAGENLVIQDSFRASGQTWDLTAVYNKNRVDQGVQDSLIPMYMVSPTLIFIFLGIAAGCIALTALIISGWLGKAVLIPLQELKKGADMVARNDLDYRIAYSGSDEFGDVCDEYDHMRLQLKEAKKKQKAYEEERRELLRGISHDLRSPLTSIKGYAMGLKDGIADTEEKRARYYDAILTRADDMERLTESLSILVRLENDRSMFHFEKVCLDEYIRQLLTEKASWLEEHRVTVDHVTETVDAEADIDIREMQRVFMNLFENTVRYRTAAASRVQILVSKRSDSVEIRFADDGPGVGRKHLKHLFETFYRADASRTSPEKGSGIGLAVVRRIIEGHGGQVFASSGNGLCITMILPSAKEAHTDEENSDR